MSRRRVVPGLLFVLFVAAAPALRADDEPDFLGKGLSHWIKQLNEGKSLKERTLLRAVGVLIVLLAIYQTLDLTGIL